MDLKQTSAQKKDENAAQTFYTEMGNLARQQGTVISILGIEGQSCGIGVLGVAAELSSGGVNLVNPLELQRQMRQIIDNSIIAIGVTVSRRIGIREARTLSQCFL